MWFRGKRQGLRLLGAGARGRGEGRGKVLACVKVPRVGSVLSGAVPGAMSGALVETGAGLERDQGEGKLGCMWAWAWAGALAWL